MRSTQKNRTMFSIKMVLEMPRHDFGPIWMDGFGMGSFWNQSIFDDFALIWNSWEIRFGEVGTSNTKFNLQNPKKRLRLVCDFDLNQFYVLATILEPF